MANVEGKIRFVLSMDDDAKQEQPTTFQFIQVKIIREQVCE